MLEMKEPNDQDPVVRLAAGLRKGVLLVLSGPSGAGKGTLCQALLQSDPSLKLSVSATTRQPRTGEVEGVNYYFYSREQFMEARDREEFLEWASVYDNFYGTPKKVVLDSLERGEDVILEIDPQGALQVKERFADAVLAFIAPPNLEELARRIIGRGTDAPEVIEKRLGQATSELELAKKYDYFVINDEVSKALEKLKAIIKAERSRIPIKEG